MRIGILGGHAEHLHDAAHMFRDWCGYDVAIIGGFWDHKRDPDPGFTNLYPEYAEQIEQGILEYEALYGYDPVQRFIRPYSVSDHLKRKGLDTLVSEISKEVDIFYGYVEKYVSVYYKHKPMFWHLNGGQNRTFWRAIQTVVGANGQPVCYSEAQGIQFHGRLPVIHFGFDPDIFCGWDGEDPSILYTASSLKERSKACHEDVFIATRGKQWYLTGLNNEHYGPNARCLSFSEYLEKLRKSRLFFNLGTEPAPYTMAPCEAAMVGMPLVTYDYIHPEPFPYYQVPELFGDGCVVAKSPKQVSRLLRKHKQCKKIGEIARNMAIEHFNISDVASKWKDLIDAHMV